MSRNSEKAQSALNRLQEHKKKEAGVLESNPNLRPKYVQSVESLPQAEKWRSTIMAEISSKLTRIQDPTLNDYQIRELNDSLNKLFKEKRAWEYHIKELGGSDYITYGNNLNSIGIRADGAGTKGYRYFGRAAELSEAQEYIKGRKKFKKEENRSQDLVEKKVINERLLKIDALYYGLLDEKKALVKSALSGHKSGDVRIDKTLAHVLNPILDSYNDDDSDSSIDSLLEQEEKANCALAQKNIEKDSLMIDAIPPIDIISKWLIEKRKQDIKLKLQIK
ncbi:uncharacterized protein PRCAT00002670001 [Priceomyces carsonii]|uniref:uncharacterized protein n=1 Tax=Priceomyces carsonii TaxID=28549 RepID=UPI002EDB96A2|nr:unnamed protein product [Priceomyces carsonii]